MSNPGRAVLLAVGGGIAAYKSAALCSRLVQDGYQVRAVMTASSQQFIGAATLAALTGRPVATDTFSADTHPLGTHIELTRDADLMLVAPATANLMAKFAHGIADDVVSTLYLQASCPVWIAPAMSDQMWNKPSVQRNVDQLKIDGCHFIGPDKGWLSCRVQGDGRMADPDAIFQEVQVWAGDQPTNEKRTESS